MKTLKNKFVFLLLAAFAVSCSSDSDTGPTGSQGSLKDVYTSGFDIISNVKVPTYWKNGVATALPNNGFGGEARSVCVVGDDVYACGWQEGGSNIAKYWKNGVAVNLPSGVWARAYAMVVSGSDVHVVGHRQLTGTGYFVATYWKNGVAINLSDGADSNYAYGLAVSGSDVYVCGKQETAGSSNAIAKYWKNGIAVNLTGNAAGNVANAVTVSGSDVYVVGRQGTDVKLWKNNVGTTVAPLPGGSAVQVGNGIAVNGSDVYVSGAEYVGGFYAGRIWKNGLPTPLNSRGEGNGVAVTPGGDVYIAGGEWNGSKYVARLWTNGTPATFTIDTSTYGTLLSVFLTYN